MNIVAEQKVYWLGELGGWDDFGRPYKLEPGGVMYDARLKQEPMWANMTQKSWEEFGCGRLGLGYGQKYVMQADGRWLKVEG